MIRLLIVLLLISGSSHAEWRDGYDFTDFKIHQSPDLYLTTTESTFGTDGNTNYIDGYRTFQLNPIRFIEGFGWDPVGHKGDWVILTIKPLINLNPELNPEILKYNDLDVSLLAYEQNKEKIASELLAISNNGRLVISGVDYDINEYLNKFKLASPPNDIKQLNEINDFLSNVCMGVGVENIKNGTASDWDWCMGDLKKTIEDNINIIHYAKQMTNDIGFCLSPDNRFKAAFVGSEGLEQWRFNNKTITKEDAERCNKVFFFAESSDSYGMGILGQLNNTADPSLHEGLYHDTGNSFAPKGYVPVGYKVKTIHPLGSKTTNQNNQTVTIRISTPVATIDDIKDIISIQHPSFYEKMYGEYAEKYMVKSGKRQTILKYSDVSRINSMVETCNEIYNSQYTQPIKYGPNGAFVDFTGLTSGEINDINNLMERITTYFAQVIEVRKLSHDSVRVWVKTGGQLVAGTKESANPPNISIGSGYKLYNGSASSREETALRCNPNTGQLSIDSDTYVGDYGVFELNDVSYFTHNKGFFNVGVDGIINALGDSTMLVKMLSEAGYRGHYCSNRTIFYQDSQSDLISSYAFDFNPSDYPTKREIWSPQSCIYEGTNDYAYCSGTAETLLIFNPGVPHDKHDINVSRYSSTTGLLMKRRLADREYQRIKRIEKPTDLMCTN